MNLFDFSNVQPGFAASSMRSQLDPFGYAFDVTGGVKMAPAPYAPGTTQEQADIIQQSYKTPSVETPTTSIDPNKLKNMSDEELDTLIQSFVIDSSLIEQPTTEQKPLQTEEEGFIDRNLKIKSSESFAPTELAKDVGKFFVNLPGDSAQVVGELANIALHPIDTTTSVLKAGQGLSDKLVYGIGNSIVRQFGGKEVSPTEEAQMIDAIGTNLKENYGTAGKLKKAIVENPADVLLNVVGGLGVAKNIAQARNLTNVVSKIDKLQQVVNPVNILKKEAQIVSKGAKLLGEAGAQVLGKTTGVGAEGIKTAIKEGGKSDFIRAMRGDIPEEQILGNARDALQKLKDNKRDLYGSDYDTFKAKSDAIGQVDNTDITKSFLERIKNDFGVTTKKNGELDFSKSTISKSSEVNEVQGIYDDLKGFQKSNLDGMDTLKQRIQNRFVEGAEGRRANAIITATSQDVRSKISGLAPEYAAMDSRYAEATKNISDITKTLALGDKQSKMTAITRLQQTMKDNLAFRKEMLDKLEELSGVNLRGQIAGSAMQAWMPKGLAWVVSGGAGAYSILNPSVWPIVVGGIASSSPRLIGEIANAIGTPIEKLKKAIEIAKTKLPLKKSPIISNGKLQSAQKSVKSTTNKPLKKVTSK